MQKKTLSKLTYKFWLKSELISFEKSVKYSNLKSTFVGAEAKRNAAEIKSYLLNYNSKGILSKSYTSYQSYTDLNGHTYINTFTYLLTYASAQYPNTECYEHDSLALKIMYISAIGECHVWIFF